MKNSQSTAKDTQLPDTLTKLPEQNRTEQTDTKEWDLHSLLARNLGDQPTFGQLAGGDWASPISSRKCGFHGATHKDSVK